MAIEIKQLTGISNISQVTNNLEDLVYNGVEFFNSIYMQKLVVFASEKLNIGELGQECYLGYVPEQDLFISGWDTWEDECYDEEEQLYANGSGDKTPEGCVALIKFINDEFIVIDTLGYGGEKFYKNKYKQMKEKYPTLIDIRLD